MSNKAYYSYEDNRLKCRSEYKNNSEEVKLFSQWIAPFVDLDKTDDTNIYSRHELWSDHPKYADTCVEDINNDKLGWEVYEKYNLT